MGGHDTSAVLYCVEQVYVDLEFVEIMWRCSVVHSRKLAIRLHVKSMASLTDDPQCEQHGASPIIG